MEENNRKIEEAQKKLVRNYSYLWVFLKKIQGNKVFSHILHTRYSRYAICNLSGGRKIGDGRRATVNGRREAKNEEGA